MVKFQLLRAVNYEPLGYIPFFVFDEDERPAKEQFDARYVGRWHSFEGHTLNHETMALKYPGDPPILPLAKAELPPAKHRKHEVIYVYEYGWVLILQSDGSFEVARLD